MMFMGPRLGALHSRARQWEIDEWDIFLGGYWKSKYGEG